MRPIELLCLVLVLLFAAVGCENKLNKLPEVTKSTEQTEPTKSLHEAAADGDIDQVKSLLSRGAEVSAKDDYGQTPLHYAVVKGQKNIVEFLLTKGARIGPKDNAGRTPLHYAAGAGQNYGRGVGDSDIARLLLDKGANINAEDKWSWTPLHYATLTRHKAVLELLINGGADLSAVNERARTALSLARGGLRVVARGWPAASEVLGRYGDIADLLCKDGSVYYVAPDGKDYNPGTLKRPFKSLYAAIDVAGPGDIIYVRGGVYRCSSTIHIDQSGEQGKPIRLRAYPGEAPVLDFSVANNDGFLITCAYWHIKGLSVTNTEYWGITLVTNEAHHNILEQISTYHNALTGIKLFNGAAHNLVLNCDSYRNFDPSTNGENADGFATRYSIGMGNIFIGDRAWNNSDDGFDFWYADSGVRVENCYAYRNGANIWGHPLFKGNANGFKLNGTVAPYVLIRCAAWDHRRGGFIRGVSTNGITLYNCTALRNRFNYRLGRTDGIEKHILRNNLSYKGRISIDPKADDQFNSWNESLEGDVTQKEFLSLDDSIITGVRNPDGSLPESDFLRLAPGSDAIDAGTDVGLAFIGRAPGLGAFEYRPPEAKQIGIKWLHQAVRDHDIEKIQLLLSEEADVDEKDWLGYAPLHWACYFGYPDLVELLLTKGANTNLISDTGRTPLEIVTEMGYENIAELLRKHVAKE